MYSKLAAIKPFQKVCFQYTFIEKHKNRKKKKVYGLRVILDWYSALKYRKYSKYKYYQSKKSSTYSH